MVKRTAGAISAGSTLSVVLPNYNHARYLPRALDALLSQDYPASEIIVVDDCSTDESRDIVARYAAMHPSVRLLPSKKKKNVGAIATLTRGHYAARGKYVYYGAADDVVMPGFFSLAVQMLEAHPEAGLFCGEAIQLDGHSGKSLGFRPPVRPLRSSGFIGPTEAVELLRHNDNFIVTGAAVFRRDAAGWGGAFEERLSSFADGYLVRKVALTYGFCFAPHCCLTWNVFPDGVSRKTATDSAQAWATLKNIDAQMAADPVFPPWYRELFARRWRFSASRLAAQGTSIDGNLLNELGAQNALDRALFGWVLKMFNERGARFVILSWLWLRFRPISLIGLVSTALARRLNTRGT